MPSLLHRGTNELYVDTPAQRLTSPKARETIDREGITVIDYRPLQQLWND